MAIIPDLTLGGDHSAVGFDRLAFFAFLFMTILLAETGFEGAQAALQNNAVSDVMRFAKHVPIDAHDSKDDFAASRHEIILARYMLQNFRRYWRGPKWKGSELGNDVLWRVGRFDTEPKFVGIGGSSKSLGENRHSIIWHEICRRHRSNYLISARATRIDDVETDNGIFRESCDREVPNSYRCCFLNFGIVQLSLRHTELALHGTPLQGREANIHCRSHGYDEPVGNSVCEA
jgi:hypothetical protein